jgi:hypothetical protein
MSPALYPSLWRFDDVEDGAHFDAFALRFFSHGFNG